MTTHNVNLHYKDGVYSVKLDGTDISHMLSGVEMRAEPFAPPRYFLELNVLGVTEIGGEAQVVFELPRALPDAALDQIMLRCEQAKRDNELERKAKELDDGER